MTTLSSGVVAVTVLLAALTFTGNASGAAEQTNAQAAAAVATDGGGGGSSDNDVINVVRRSYVPQFLGKRQDESESKTEETNDSSIFEDSFDLENLDEDVQNLVNYWNSFDYDNSKDTGSDKLFSDEDDIDISEGLSENGIDDDNLDLENNEEKRYQPSFVGKRGPYNPMFVGKRYQPMFVGKRYRPMFVGKRYQPSFVGKRYQPTFVGKRYHPTFVGKRYTPSFVGKRYTPSFVGKRYTPSFVGKRYQPSFVGKRYQPTFVGKRYTPSFVGKRDVSNSAEQSLIEKRSTADSMESQIAETNAVPNVRRRRSLADDESDEYKRAWGRYMPWKNLVDSSYNKRFVAPEFIGRRDSLSSILNALDELAYMRHPSKSTSKRFEAPMFIGKRPYQPAFVGKRGPMRPMFVGKRAPFTSEMNTDNAHYGLATEWSSQPLSYSETPELSLFTNSE